MRHVRGAGGIVEGGAEARAHRPVRPVDHRKREGQCLDRHALAIHGLQAKSQVPQRAASGGVRESATKCGAMWGVRVHAEPNARPPLHHPHEGPEEVGVDVDPEGRGHGAVSYYQTPRGGSLSP